MKKRIFSTFLAAMLVVGIFPTAAFAAGATDTWAVELNVSENSKFKYNEQNVLEIAYGIQSNNLTARNAQHMAFAVDLTVFDFLVKNGKQLTDTLTTNLSDNLGGKTVFATYSDPELFITWNATCKFARSADGNTGYVVLQPNQGDGDFPSTKEVSIASILIGFKKGKSTNDLTSTSIRFMNAAEAYSLTQTSVVSLTNGNGNVQKYLPKNLTDKPLTVTPRVDWGTITIPLPPLRGTVAITGTPKYNETLTATASTLSDGATPAYQWYRGSTLIDGATAATYPIVEADIGKALTVKVSDSSGTYSGTVDATPTAVVAKQDYTGTATKAIVTSTADTVTVAPVISGQEYAITTGNTEPSTGWQTTGAFTKLTANTAYTVYTRVQATATTNASPSVPTSVTTSKQVQTITALDQSVMVEGTLNLVARSNAPGATLDYSQGSTPPAGTTLTGSTVTAGTTPGNFTVKINSAAVDSYAAAAEKIITVTVSAATANDMTVSVDKTSAQYGDTFVVTGIKGTGNSAALAFPESGTNCKRTALDANGLQATYQVTASTGNASVTVTQAAASGVAQGSASRDVALSKRIVTLTGTLTAANKVYDGTTAATINELPSTLVVSNKLADDSDIALAGTFAGSAFASKNAASATQAVTLGTGSVTISGANATHYTLTGTTFPTVAAQKINKRPITVSLNSNITKVYGVSKTLTNGDFTAQATATNAGLAVGESIANLGITAYTCAGQADDAIVGEYPVTALAATTTNYAVSIAGTNKLTVTRATQAALNLTGVATTATYGDGKMTPIATGGSGTGTVTYAIITNTDNAATLTDGGTKIQIEKPGSFTVQATKPADDNYKEATSASITCTVSKKALALNKNALSGKLGDGATGYDLSDSTVPTGYVTATVPDGLKSLTDASATISYGPVADDSSNVGGVIAGTTLTWETINAGTFTFPVTMADNAYYTLNSDAGANVVTVTIDARTPQSIDFTTSAPATITYGDGDFTVTAAGGAGTGDITYASSDDTVATVDPATGLVHIVKAGTVTITATKAEDATYAKATVNTGALNIVKKGLTVIDGTYAVSKVYDGGTAAGAAAGALGLDGIVESDDVSLTGMVVGAYVDKTAADAKTVSITGLSLTGAKAENYSVADTYRFTKAAITKKSVTLTTTATKVYDGSNVVALADITSSFAHAAVDGIVDGETITVTAITGATYNTKDVHSSTALAAAGTPTYSVEAANYEITWVPGNGAITTTLLTPVGATTLSKGTSEMSGLKVSDFLTSVTGNIAPDTKATLFDGAVTGPLVDGAITVDPFTITFYTDAGRTATATAIPATAGTYYYKITGAATDPYKTNYSLGTLSEVLGTLTVTAPIVPPPSGGGGGGVTPPEPVKPEPPKTDPVTGNTNVEIVVKPETKGDTSTAVVPDKTMTDAISSVVKEAAKTGGTSSVEIVIDAPKDAKTVEAELTRTIIRAVAESEVDSLKVTSPVASITFDTQALATIAAEAAEEKVIISAVIVPEKKLDAAQKALVGDAPVYELKVMSGNKIISDFKGGTATITIPYELKAGEKAEFVTVWYLDDAGKLIPIQGKYEDGFVTFTVGHFSRYAIGYLPFTDVKADWAYESIVYAYQNKLLSGVGNEKFAPADNMTRAMLWTVLYRAAGSPAKTDNANWYADAQAWAMAEKISDGTNPTGNVTRQELATILYRYAKSTAVQADMSGFSDMAEVAEWAADGMNWAVANGILKGIGDKLNPAGNATRAQVATMLQRYLTK